MVRRRAEGLARSHWREVSGAAVIVSCFALCVITIATGHHDQVGSLTTILGFAAVAAGFLAVGEFDAIGVSASFIVYVLAAAFLGPASAAAAAVLSELSAAIRYRSRWQSVALINLPTNVAAAVLASLILRTLASHPRNSAGFFAAVVGAGIAALVVSFALFSLLRRLFNSSAEQYGLSALLEVAPGGGLSILLAVAGVGITLNVGNAGIGFALAAVFAFSYMAHLLQQSRQRAQQYVSLSWGVLAGLMRSLDIRDQRTARHSAAVARFARDIAMEVGMSEAECELAHTAGLLHDIGRFALSDRVAERGRTLTDEDWVAIQRHPELGADMLRDLGMYGPVAEIVLAHHERIDGRGYPNWLAPEQIPPIAKIIAVAEVYDTLTASDTYRTQMSSFEALRELRRVAGSQLDGHYVEVLASLLTGEGLEYRHANTADFDGELNMERRIGEAGG